MQVRSAASLPTRNVPVRALTSAAKPAAPPAPAAAAKRDNGVGSEIFQNTLFSLANLGQIIPLPAAIAGFVQMVPKPFIGIANLALGVFNTFKDVMGLRKAGNVKRSDDYTRLAGDAAVLAGGAAMFFGAVYAPILPVIGVGLAAAGFLTRIVGVWNDDTRL